MEQRFTFDEVAALYNPARPEYPQALCDDIVSAAGLKPDDAVLDVGCGTGQATKLFAPLGFRILAMDPGPELISVARESLAEFANVAYAVSTFEAWSSKPAAFRLIIAAQSWHWVAPEIRFAKASEALSPDGYLAVFGNVPVGLPAPLLDAFRETYLRYTGAWGPPPEAWYLASGPFKAWFDESGYFAPVIHKSYPWTWRHTAASYTDFLRTRSDYRLLAPKQQEELRAAIAEAIAAYGGQFDMPYEAHLYMARRAA